MKNFKIFFIAAFAIAAGFITACNDSDFEAGPAVDGAQVYFPENVATQHSISDDVSSITVPVKRIAKDAAMSVAILAEEPSGLFTIPSSVVFAAGEDTANLLITFDRTRLEDGVEYPISFLINDEDNTTPYGNRTLDITVAPWPWNELGTGKYREDWMCNFFSGEHIEIDVTIHEHKSRPGVYMIEEMFGWPYMTEFFGATQAELSAQFSYTSSNIVIDCSDPEAVTIARQSSGIRENNHDYGTFYIFSDPDAPGTLVNGVITFPDDAVIIACDGSSSDAGAYAANGSGMFRIILPGIELTDYSLSAAYGGMKADVDNEAVRAVIDFSYGADVTGISYLFMNGNLAAAADQVAEAVLAGDIQNIYEVSDFTVGAEKVSIEAGLAAPAIYTVFALPKDRTGALIAEQISAAPFYFPGLNGGPIPDCDAAAELMAVSDFNPAYLPVYPEHTSIACVVTGTQLTAATIYLNTTALIDNIESGAMGLTLDEVIDTYGQQLSAAQLQVILSNGYWATIFGNLAPDTSFTLAIKATSVYGKSVLTKSNAFSTSAAPAATGLSVGSQAASAPGDVRNLADMRSIPAAAGFSDIGTRSLPVRTARCEPLAKPSAGRISIKPGVNPLSK